MRRDAKIVARRVVLAVTGARFRFASEEELQRGIAAALADAGVGAEREVRLTPRDRIDLLAGRVGVEVKVAGLARDVERQLARYAASDRVDALVLVTTRAGHRPPEEINGKPVLTVFLGARL